MIINKFNYQLIAGQISPSTRFIGIGKISISKDKNKKWLHALSLEPIVHMTKEEICAELPSTTDCPYVEVGSVVPNLEFTGPQIKKLKTEDLIGMNV